MKKSLVLIILLSVSCVRAGSPGLSAGFRGSKIWGYPTRYWGNVADSLSRSFSAPAAPAGVWITTFYGDAGDIYATFPSGGTSIPHVSFTSTDYNENFLLEFDRRGMRIWLQVEPGAASVGDLIDVVLTRYKHHPSVVGFGVDVEWLDAQSSSGGRRVTDAEAAAWETKVRSYDTTYTLFLKHYTENRMPPAYRGDILFVDDSQQFTSLASCVNEFKAWGNSFGSSKVAFQFGYPDDRPWWSALQNPPATIGNALLSAVPNVAALFWVDFTIAEVFPVATMSVADAGGMLHRPVLMQNYPNPFNPKTVVSCLLPVASKVRLIVYDLLGRELATLLDEQKEPGTYEVQFDGTGLPSGVYFCRLLVDGSPAGSEASVVQTRKMVILK
jgi:hypothetical protein